MASKAEPEVPERPDSTNNKYLCLTIWSYRNPEMSEDEYRKHMINISAPMTKDLKLKYDVKTWTQIHNKVTIRSLMGQLLDPQMASMADFDCFSQVFFKDIEDYKRMKQDQWYNQYLNGEHGDFIDTKRSVMTIEWVEESVRDGKVVDGSKDC